MKKFSLAFTLIFLFSSCAPATTVAVHPTKSLTATIAPTATYTLTPSPTFTPTMTPTITPTPLGGGSGQIICEYCNGKPGMSLINFDGTGEIFLTEKDSRGASFYWSRNGARLGYFSITGTEGQEKYLTCVIDAHGYNEQCFEIGGGNFSLSPDGSKMAIEHDLKFYIVDLDSGKSEILMEAPSQWSGWDVDWSPDGTKLVVAGGEIGITVINFMNNERYSVVEADKPDYYIAPRWSPDGKKIVYVKRSNLFIVNADGSGETLLVRNAFHPIWSPDGTKIAYFTGSNNQRNIIMMNIDGTNKIRLTPSQLLDDMIWSLDGNYIIYSVFTGNRNTPSFDLYSVEVANQKVFSLAINTGRHPSLSPDGSMIFYTTWTKSEDRYIYHTYLATMDGTIISELNIPGFPGPWRPTSGSGGSTSLTPPTKGQSWEFNADGDTEGWDVWNQLDPLQIRNGSLITKSTGNDPYMASPRIYIGATDFPRIEIRMKISAGNTADLYFITGSESIYDESKVLHFPIISDGQFHIYSLNMSTVKTWSGEITQIRFDPTNSQADIEIDYIHFLP